MTPAPQDLIAPLYLGIQEDAIPRFLRLSFDGKRPRRSEGPPVLLSSNFARAYVKGVYEEDGSVLEVWWHKGTRRRYRPMALERIVSGWRLCCVATWGASGRRHAWMAIFCRPGMECR